MAIARFFDRIHAAVGVRLAASRTTLKHALGDARVFVRCGDDVLESANDRWTAEVLVNVLARLYPTVALRAPGELQRDLVALAKSINPDIAIREPRPTDEHGAEVAIGAAPSSGSAIRPRADGWVARLLSGDVGTMPRGPANPYAAAFAAGLAAGEAFRRIFAERLPVATPSAAVSVSLLDFGPEEGADLPLTGLDLGAVAVVGLGAVGCPAVWALARHEGLRGALDLVDPEEVDLSNLQRYLLATTESVGRLKTDLAAEALAGTKFDVRRHPVTLEAVADAGGDRFAIPTIAISVDTVAGRRQAQALLPRLVVNGWTSEGGLGASWHDFDEQRACLACLYHPRGTAPSQTELAAEALGLQPRRAAEMWLSGQPLGSADLAEIAKGLSVRAAELDAWEGKRLSDVYTEYVCGHAPIDLTGSGRTEAVPLAHQSLLAGVLFAAELVKRLDPVLSERSQPDPLVIWDDVLRPPPGHWVQPRVRVPGCICGDPDYRAVHGEKWAQGLPPESSEPAGQTRT